MNLLEGKTVLVTGASTAIGAAQHDADVAINYHSRDHDAEAVMRIRCP